MKPAPRPPDEEARQRALEGLHLLDTPRDERFDRITRLARDALNVSFSAVALVDQDRLWFKSIQGLSLQEIPRDGSFAAHTILSRELFEVPDARRDDRFRDVPLVQRAPRLRFYAGRPLAAPDGHLVGSLCVFDPNPRALDPTEARLLESLGQLAENALAVADLERFFDLSLDMLVVAGVNGYFKRVNPAWERALGYPREELLKRPFLDFVHPEDQERTAQEAAALAAGHDTVFFENRYRHRDGHYRWLRWTATHSPGENRLFGVARDITAHKEQLAQEEAALAAAEQANRAKSEFLATMSHELRTPLNSIIGFANVLLRGRDADDGQQEVLYLERIRDNGMHLLGLINEVLDLSKVEAGGLELERVPVDPGQLAAEVCAQLEGSIANERVELELQTPPDLEPLESDPQRLKQILINLVGNAIKFTPRGAIVVRIVPDAGGTRPRALEVEDTGIGIDPAARADIFQPFVQGEAGHGRRYGGTGLGLSFSRALAQRLGYALSVRSQLGRGSTFRVDFNPAGSVQAG